MMRREEIDTYRIYNIVKVQYVFIIIIPLPYVIVQPVSSDQSAVTQHLSYTSPLMNVTK